MSDQRGFTLLEVLVALVIAAMALGVLFQTAGSGLLNVRTAGNYEEAISRARSHLAAIGNDVRLSSGELNGDDGGGYHWRIVIKPIATSAAPSGPAPTAESGEQVMPRVTLFSVEVAISWMSDGQPREVTLRTERLGLRESG